MSNKILIAANRPPPVKAKKEPKAFDLSLSYQPGKKIKGEWQSEMPFVLQALMPTSGFNPKKEYELYKAEELAKEAKIEKEKVKKKKDSKKTTQTKDEIRAENIQNSEAEDISTDRSKINYVKNDKNPVPKLINLLKNLSTGHGQLELRLEILDKCTDKSLAYDVLWAIEDNKLYQTADAEIQFKVQEELKKRALKEKSKDEKKSKKDKDKDKDEKKKKKKEKEIVVTSENPITELVLGYRSRIEEVKKMRAVEDDIVAYQLKEMSDKLPPLSPFTGGFKLDPWQIRVLKMIDNQQSVVVSAPTSSGKTVISTYVASMGRGNGVLFVVPTEPLVWQVAAHFAKHFNGDVALVTNQMTYSPHTNPNEPPSVVVGTPLALESSLTKIRGKATSIELESHKLDRAQLPGGFDHYKWCVYDEIHSLDGDEGAALQRIIRLMKCNFLALSATIGNAEDLRSWMEVVRGEQFAAGTVNALTVPKTPAGGWTQYDTSYLYTEVDRLEKELEVLKNRLSSAEAYKQPTDTLRAAVDRLKDAHRRITSQIKNFERQDNLRLVQIHNHSSRFINIQRHVWTDQKATKENGSSNADVMELQLLNPLAAVTLKFLRENGFSSSALPMTPLDSYNLWKGMSDVYPADEVAHLNPKVFFNNLSNDSAAANSSSSNSSSSSPDEESASPNEIVRRITLQETKTYEDRLKHELTRLAQMPEHEEATEKLLLKYKLEAPPQEFDITALVMSLKKKEMLSALLFHLNPFELIELFKQLLGGLEREQKLKHPTFYTDKEKAKQRLEETNASANLGANTAQDKLDAEKEKQQVSDVDYNEPHKDFILDAKNPVTVLDIDQICKQLKEVDKFEGDLATIAAHPLMRALRRGIGLYIDDHHFTAYRLAVMRLAMQNKLAVVLSDVSLAYGVNMPFRTCVYCGEMGGHLDSLIAQQMAGRSGRRGLEPQGHMVYAGARVGFIQNLMLARIPAIRGKEPRYHTQFLQEMMSKFANPQKFGNQGEVLGGITLAEFIDRSKPENAAASVDGIALKVEGVDLSVPESSDFRQISIATLMELKLIEECNVLAVDDILDLKIADFNGNATRSGYRPVSGSCQQLWMVWEMRQSLPESVLMGLLLPQLYNEFIFRKKLEDLGQGESVQLAFLCYLLLVINRKPAVEGQSAGNQPNYNDKGRFDKPLREHTFITGKTDLKRKLDTWFDSIAHCQQQVGNCMVSQWLELDLPLMTPLDATVMDCIVYNDHSQHLSPEVKELVKNSLTEISKTLIILHNNFAAPYKVLNMDNPNENIYARFEIVTRKLFQRLQYISRELIHSMLQLDNVCSRDYEKRSTQTSTNLVYQKKN